MTKLQLLQHLVHQAGSHGFELRRWFRTDAAVPWPGGDAAMQWLCQGTRVNLLLFSHSFAASFFGGPERLRHVQAATEYERTARNGVTRTVYRRAFPRSARYDEVWRYHLQRMVASPDPLSYAQQFLVSVERLNTADTLVPGPQNPLPPPEPHYDEELLVRED